MKDLQTGNLFAIKETAVKYAPAGQPKFEAVFANSTQISILNAALGQNNVVKIIYLLIVDLNEYFNVKQKMNEHQITDLAFELSEELKTYRFEEIIVLFECIKKQTYGKIYERLDQSIIWEHFKKYDEQRNMFFENEHLQTKQVDNHRFDTQTERMAGRINEIGGAFSVLKDFAKENQNRIEKALQKGK